MPLPLILGGAAAIAGAVGIGSAVHGGVKMKEANDTMKWAESKHRESITGFETQNKKTTADMDRLGKKELEILDSFQKFSNIFERSTTVRNLSLMKKRMSAFLPIMQKS